MRVSFAGSRGIGGDASWAVIDGSSGSGSFISPLKPQGVADGKAKSSIKGQLYVFDFPLAAR
jgi:hypothetical protein